MTEMKVESQTRNKEKTREKTHKKTKKNKGRMQKDSEGEIRSKEMKRKLKKVVACK